MMRTFDINPDGVKLEVNWGDMVIGSSIFVPCINTNKAKQQLERITEDWGWEVIIKVVLENQKWGVRLWRTK